MRRVMKKSELSGEHVGLTDRFNPFSVGQMCQTQHSNTIRSYLGQGQPVQESTEGAEGATNHFSLFKTMSIQHLSYRKST